MSSIYVDTIVSRLMKIYEMEFGGKPNGRFKICYQRMQQVTGKTIINPTFLFQLQECAFNSGLTIINLGSEFAVIETGILTGYRNVPQGSIDKILKE
ncbi:hypothetical protein [Halobacteriovorax sp. JY17]|uniref:hypothetical protein n=1 Tax=Halobacteriovorax sp. JY17 TaxID=2014617 RepID=UPI000C409DD3|nr:hypothetical protein [Halobacteriovorax sp. JY17]PIK14384.1 MAG: hypothetical protein CES88_08560 [Halobacteriovorax sp. JY17]